MEGGGCWLDFFFFVVVAVVVFGCWLCASASRWLGSSIFVLGLLGLVVFDGFFFFFFFGG